METRLSRKRNGEEEWFNDNDCYNVQTTTTFVDGYRHSVACASLPFFFPISILAMFCYLMAYGTLNGHCYK